MYFPNPEGHPQPTRLLPGAELMSVGLHGQVTKYGCGGIRKVDLGPNYGDSGCLELKAGRSPRERFRLATNRPGWSKTVLTNNDLQERKYLFSRNCFRHSLVEKTNLDFSTMFFESRPLRYNFTPYQAFTIWNVFYHPHLHIYPPTQAAIPHIAHRYLHKIPPNVFIPRTHPTRVEGDKTPHGAVGL